MAKVLNIKTLYEWLLDRHPPAAWLILLLSLLVTSWAWYISDKAVTQTIEERFEFQAQDLATAITNRMREYELALRSGAALFDASSAVTREDWNSFATTIYLHKYFPGIQALGYSVMLSPDELSAHIEKVRQEGFEDYTVSPEGERDQYSAIQFIEPFDWRNQRAFGFDMYSNPVRRDAMDRARDTGQPATSGRVTLVQETNENIQYGFLMYYPVYHANMPVDYVEERRRALKSYVYAAFRMGDLMQGILGQAQGELEFAVYDGAVASNDAVLYNSETAQDYASAASTASFGGYYTLNITGRPWTLHVYTAEGFVAFSEKHQPTFIVLVGILLDIFLFYLISFLARGRKQAHAKALWAETERDVTERRLQLAAEAANMGLAEWNLGENKLIWDRRMLDLYGYTAEEFDGNVEAWSSRVHPDDIEQVMTVLEHAKRFSNHFDMAFRIILPDQRIRYIVASVIVERDLADNPIRMVGFNYDVTEQREADRKLNEHNWHLQNVLESTDAGTWEWSLYADTVNVNERWAEIIGYQLSDIKPVTANSWQSFIHPEDKQDFEQELRRYFDKKVDHYACAMRLKHKQGHWVWVMARGKVFSWDKEGKPQKMFGTMHDISDQKKQEAQLIEERDKAEMANRSRGEFLANMSHEIRTPINGVIGALNLLSDTRLNASQQNLVTISKRSADSLLGLINDILDLSKIESGKLQIKEEPVELSGLLSDTAVTLAARAEAKGLTLLCPSHHMPVMRVMVDGLRVRQIITNLLSNAIKFTEKGQVAVDVEILNESRSHLSLRFNVRDTGQGISQDKLATLFRRFEQLDNSLTRREGGTGLGLAICKQLVEMMHGRIGVESEQGKGTTFWFELDVDRAGQEAKQKSMTVFADLSLQIVRPSPLYQSYYESLSAAWGISYDLVSDVILAAQRFEKSSAVHNVLLLDAELFNGKHKKPLSEWQRWRQKQNNVTVIVTCQQSMLAMVPQAINDVADLIVSKPVVQSELFESLLAIVKDDLASRDAATTNVMQFEHFDASVLVVEDNPTNVTIVTGLLHKFGVDVSLAENGVQALTMLEHNHYDLVLMDCQMPELDGYETTRRIRQSDSATPIIALTAQAMREDEQKCLDAGMNAYLTKPIDPYQLNKLLAEWLPENCLKKVAT